MTLVPLSAAESPEPPTPSRRRSKLPWIIGGAALAALLLAAAVVAIVVFLAPHGPAQAVTDFDTAYDTADCDLWQRVTTEGLRSQIAVTCDDFTAVSADFTSHYSGYSVVVTDSTVTGDSAVILTTESWRYDGEADSGRFEYDLVEQDGVWKVDALVESATTG